MARKAAFTIPSLEEMERADQQAISVYAALKGGTGKSSSASSSDVPNASTSHASAVTHCAVVSTSLQDNVNSRSRTSKPPPVKPPLVSSVKSGITTKPTSVKIVPVLSGNKHQGNRPTSGAVAPNTASGMSEPAAGVGLSKPGKTNAIIVSARQKGNPVLKFIRNVPWEFGDIVPDYQLGQTSCALFLSTRYHLLYPEYVHERLKQLGHSFDLRVLLMLIDVKDPHHALKEVAKMCILADCSLILAFSVEEAGRYLETYKSFEKKPPDLIMEKTEANFLAQVTDVFTSARKINKTDAMTVLSAFGTVKGVLQSTEDELSLCPGFGPQKAQRLHRLIHEPFIKAKKTKSCQPTDETGGRPSSSSASVDSKKQEKKQREKV